MVNAPSNFINNSLGLVGSALKLSCVRYLLIAIIGNDSSWTQIARDQVEIFKDPVATELGNTKYHEVVEALGGQGLQITDKKEIDDVLNTAKDFASAGKSVAINVKIGKTDFRKGSISI